MSAPWARAIAAYVSLSMRRRRTVACVALLTAAACAVMARRVHVDSRLEALLPVDLASVAAQQEMRHRLRAGSPLYLLVDGATIEQSRKVARMLYQRVLSWPETRWAMYKRDPQYFLDHRLLYLPAGDLEELDDRIGERIRWEKCARVPGCVNLEDTPPQLPSERELRTLFESNPDIRALTSLFGKDAGALSTGRPRKLTEANAQESPSPQAEELGELCDVENAVCTVVVTLEGDPGNLEFATRILTRSEALFDSVKQEIGESQLRMAVSGPYRNAPMTQRAVARDLTKTTLVSVLLVLGIVLLQFRGARSLIALLLPAALGILYTVGVLGALGVTLNLISAFTLAVLAGVGIDFGVHLLTHYSRARTLGHPPERAAQQTLVELAPSLVVAAITTSCGFGALAVASFRGFSEMGPIAAGGVLMCLLAFGLLFSPLVAFLDRADPCPFALRGIAVSPWSAIRRCARPLTIAGVVLAALLGALALGFVPTLSSGAGFEYDFKKLQPKGVSHGIRWGKTLHGTARNAVYLLADDQPTLDRAASALRADPPLDIVRAHQPFLLVPGAFVPRDQETRLSAIAELRDTVRQAKEYANDELRSRIEQFEPLVAVREPIQLEKMPTWVQDWLVERDGRFGTFGVLYTKLSGSDARQMEVLSNRLEQWRHRFAGLRFASPVAQLGEVTPRLRKEAPSIVGLALLGVLIATFVVGRSLRRTVTVLLPLVVTMAIALGLMALCQIHVNLYNMLVFPLAFGIGVDGAVYVAWALSSPSEGRLPTAARAVFGSTLTTTAGFGSLMVSSNPGLYSIGELAVLMLGISLAANLVWLPALAAWRLRAQP